MGVIWALYIFPSSPVTLQTNAFSYWKCDFRDMVMNPVVIGTNGFLHGVSPMLPRRCRFRAGQAHSLLMRFRVIQCIPLSWFYM